MARVLGDRNWTGPALGLKGGNVLARDECELAALKHEASEVAHHGLRLDVQIAEHDVGAPAAEELDQIRVDAGAQKCHGAPGPEGACTDILGEETDTRSLDADGNAERGGYLAGGHPGPAAGRKLVGRKWGSTDRPVEAKSFDAADGALNRAARGATTASEANDFASDTVLLVGKGEADKGGGVQIGVGAGDEIEAMVSHEELNVLEEKRAGFGLGAHRILARATQEKEGKADHVSNSTVGDGWSSQCQAEATHHNGDRNWFDASWGRVGLGIARQLALEAKINGTRGRQARVLGPHSGEALAHRTDRVLHCSRSDLSLAGGKAPIAVALGKELEEDKGIGATIEELVGAERNTEALPDAPG
jgi:hypothetical protein